MSDSKPAGSSQSGSKATILLLVAGVVVFLAAAAVWYVRNAEPAAPKEEPPAVSRPAAEIAPLVISEKPRPLAEARSDAGVGAEQDDGEPLKKRTRRPGDGPPEKAGFIEPRVVNTFINSRFGEVRSCYETRLKNNSLLEGSLDMNIDIASSGRVTGVSVNNDTVRDAEMLECVKRRIRSWTFPKPEGGRVVIAKSFKFQKKG